ncbi:MAG: rRNA pseudouridine synthase [Verrucomicrobiota bacterium]|jgi:pseudouridine synthase|nr:rRNA pseudouridine synthase [Verrucomicrobiota bacterium]
MTFSHPASEPQRLQKILAAAGLGSRRHCEGLIAAGRVQVDGHVVTELGTRADPAASRIEVDGRLVHAEPHRTYLADKPRGILCTSSDPEGRPTIVEWAAQVGADPKVRLYGVGRLDYDSEGLILLTNDGRLAHAMAHPRHHVEKEYRAWVDRPLSREQMAAIIEGVEENGELLRALEVAPEAGRGGPTLRLVLAEGRNRHIRRMLEAVGIRVKRLRRIRIGRLTEADLKGKPLRLLSERDVRGLV